METRALSELHTGVSENKEARIEQVRKSQRLQRVHDILLPLIKDKRLLDLGCIGHDFEARSAMGTFYFPEFAEHAAYAKGIDILVDDVERARRHGFEVVVGNAETFVDEQPYDVIFAGELIEHVNNAGLFLQCCLKNLKDDGVLVITTPNTFSMSRLLRCILRQTNEPPLNDEHTCYYTPQTLKQLVTREGFVIEEVYYSDYDYGKIGMKRQKSVSLGLNKALSRVAPQFSQSFIAVLKKHADPHAASLAN
jgi:SAM-dependent methyltransferase